MASSKWEPHKLRIKELFLDQKKPLKEVLDIMEINHGFQASKTQYERQLRKWDFRKNTRIDIDKDTRKLLKVKLDQRRGGPNNILVAIGGVVIPQLEIQTRANRCFVSMTEQFQLARCKTPPGIVIMTPTSEFYMACVRSNDLPWVYFQKQLASFGNLDNVLNISGQIMRSMIPNLCPDPSPLVPENVKQLVHYLCTIIPMDQDNDVMDILRTLFSGNMHQATWEFLKLTVYLLSNKLLDTPIDEDGNETRGAIFCHQLLKWFQTGHNDLLLQDILSHKTPTIEAFMESIFFHAVDAADPVILKIFLDSGINPNIRRHETRFSSLSTYRTKSDPPLHVFTQTGNKALVEMFLDANANVNHTGDLGTPLGIASERGNVELVKLLLSRGAAVNLTEHLGTLLRPPCAEAVQFAAMAGNLEIVALLLDSGAKIDANCGFSGSALECAIRVDAPALIDMLLERGADVNCAPGDEGNTALQSAAMTGKYSLVERLLDLGADVNAPAVDDGATALQRAAENGDLRMCQRLIDAGANVNSKLCEYGGNGRTALARAVQSGNNALVALLLKHGAHINDQHPDYRTALEAATESEDLQMVQMLLSVGADPSQDLSLIIAIHKKNMELISALIGSGDVIQAQNPRMGNVLFAAVTTRNLDLVRMLLNSGFCPNVGQDIDGNSALSLAVDLDQLPIIEALLDAGAQYDDLSPFENGLNPLQMACRRGNMTLVRYLLDISADVNAPPSLNNGLTALQAAVESGNMELVQYVIKIGADVNAGSSNGGMTALHSAVRQNRIDLIKVLLNAKVEVNDNFFTDFTKHLNSLQRAASNGNNDVVLLLIDHGANVNAPASQSHGRTSLQAASECGNYDTVQLLLANGADVNAQRAQEGGVTALQAAAKGGYIRIAKLLLEKEAHIDAPGSEDYFGMTALESAARDGRIDMIKLLLNAGADIAKTDAGRLQLENSMEYATYEGHDAVAKFLKYYQIS